MPLIFRKSSPAASSLVHVLLGVVMVAGVSAQIAATRFGVGVSTDTVKYARYAKMILKQEPPPLPGVTRDFLVHFPPLYPSLLAGFSLVIGDPFAAARVLQILLLAGNVWLVGLIAYWLTRSPRAAVGSSILLVSLTPTMTVHLWGWSEPLFFVWIIATLACLVRSAESPGIRWPLAAAVFAALAMLTRYAGLALLPCGALLLALNTPAGTEFKEVKRWRRACLFVLVSITPLAIFVLRNEWIAGKATNRTPGNYDVLGQRLREGARTVHDLILPSDIQSVSSIVIGTSLAIAILCIPLVLMLTSRRDDRSNRWLMGALVFEIFYLGLIVASIRFYDPSTPMDQRILSPLAVPLVVCVGIFLGRLTATYSGLIGGALVIMCGVSTGKIVFEAASVGLGFRNERWRDSEVLAALSAAPLVKGQFMFSNEPDALYAIAGRSASRLALPASSESLQFIAQRKLIAERGKVIYLTHQGSNQSGRTWETVRQVERMFNIRVTQRFKDGAILAPATPPSTQSLAGDDLSEIGLSQSKLKR